MKDDLEYSIENIVGHLHFKHSSCMYLKKAHWDQVVLVLGKNLTF